MEDIGEGAEEVEGAGAGAGAGGGRAGVGVRVGRWEDMKGLLGGALSCLFNVWPVVGLSMKEDREALEKDLFSAVSDLLAASVLLTLEEMIRGNSSNRVTSSANLDDTGSSQDCTGRGENGSSGSTTYIRTGSRQFTTTANKTITHNIQ